MAQVAGSRNAAQIAHGRSARISDVDLVDALTAKLGTKLVAFMVDKDPTTVTRWKSGTKLPDDANRALRSVYQVFQLLEPHEADATIRAWFIGTNPQLDDTSPAEGIQAGDLRKVLAAARAFLAGG